MLRNIIGCSLLGPVQCFSHDEVRLCVLAGRPQRQSAVSTHRIQSPACHCDTYINLGHLATVCLPVYFFQSLCPCFPDCILQREVPQHSPPFGAMLWPFEMKGLNTLPRNSLRPYVASSPFIDTYSIMHSCQYGHTHANLYFGL